ncbi:SDR family oxidoreductase [Fulvivirga ligni]|uniref:SDR family oxidoreductase n=1 Tax=Fulvivirga ligni TaxID=2904246 RepID=UPI001F393926|nr:SDR family oxidoreductase [Fulvivirga ligni]UII20668.1 SDR family oxidoreductase [Fulvivirga ligni]
MKKVLITGANKGIGFQVAKQMAEKGYYVYLGCRDLERGQEAVNKLVAEGLSNVEVLVIDVADSESIIKAKEVYEQKEESLDVLINNAGISFMQAPQLASVVQTDAIKQIFAVNFHGVIETTQQFLPLLKKSDAPRIANVSSDLGSLTTQSNYDWQHAMIKPVGYISSKAALNAFTVALAYELKDSNFKVNSVNPGATATDLNNHMGSRTPEFAAQIIVECATLPEDGPSGKFFSEEGFLPW